MHDAPRHSAAWGDMKCPCPFLLDHPAKTPHENGGTASPSRDFPTSRFPVKIGLMDSTNNLTRVVGAILCRVVSEHGCILPSAEAIQNANPFADDPALSAVWCDAVERRGLPLAPSVAAETVVTGPVPAGDSQAAIGPMLQFTGEVVVVMCSGRT